MRTPASHPLARPCLALMGLLWLAAPLACKRDPAPAGPSDESTSDVSDAHPDDPLGVVLRAVGAAGETPQSLVIQGDQDLWPDELADGKALDGTTLRFEPAVDGLLNIDDRRTLSFLPSQGFRPATQYTATLDTLAVLDAVHSPPVADAWSLSFTTPPLALVRVAARQRDRVAGSAEIDLVFNAPVDPSKVGPLVSVMAGSTELKPSVLMADSQGRTVRVQVKDPSLSQEQVQLDLVLDAGTPWAWDPALTAAAGTGSVTLRDGQPVEILAVNVKEGSSGYYVDVVCRDSAVSGSRWYWDRDTWDGYDVSTRCLLDADLASSVVTLNGKPATIAEGGGGFRVFGELPQGPATLRIDAGARTVDGGVLLTAYEAEFEVARRTPRISFTSRGRYLPRQAWSNLAVDHLNVEKATVLVRHVPPQNLAFWLSGEERADQRTSNLVLEQEIALDGPVDTLKTSWIDIASMLPDAERGVYEITVRGGSREASSRLLLTDMQLIAKRAETPVGGDFPTQVWGWALGMMDNAPLSGVELKLIRPSGQAVAVCRTDSSGGCLLSVPDPGVDPTEPIAIIAQRGEDLSYLRFADVIVRPEGDVSGLPYQDETPYQAAVWTDRGVYRPGDTAHLAAVVRERGFGAPEKPVPVVLRVSDPQQREVRKQVISTNDAGALAMDIPFADFATTGTWSVTLQVANQTVGQQSFSVEEFVPERLAVDASVPDSSRGAGYLATEPVPVEVSARWLFGGQAGGSRVEVECELVAAPFQPQAGAVDTSSGRWAYGLSMIDDRPLSAFALGRIEERLDEDGAGSFRCPEPQGSVSSLGSARLQARVRVFEGDSGRSTLQTASVPVHPAPYYIGLASKVDQAREGDPIPVQGRIVDWGGKVDTASITSVEVRLYRLEMEYSWIWDEGSDDTVYRRMRRRVLEHQAQVPVKNGEFTVDLQASGSGSGWLVEARAGDARTERLIEGQNQEWYWEDGENYVDQTPRPQKPGLVVVTAPDVAEPGEKVTIVTRAPYAGRMLLSLETDRVQHHEWRDVKAGDVSWSLPLDIDDGNGGTFAPNVYVTALLIKDPKLESAQAFLPDRAFGTTSITLRPSAWTQPIAITAPAEARPWSPLKVSLDLGALSEPTYATVAVVDEGILSLTRFKTPDPRDQIFARRALGVDSFETVGWTLPGDGAGASSRTGGDAAGGVGRVQMVKPVALWSGMVKVPASGKLDLSFDVPGYRGKLRVMAVAVGSQRLGSAQAEVIVRDPIVLQTTLPRFLVGGDIARIPVHLTNMSGKPQTVSVEVEIQDIEGAVPGAASSLAPALELVALPASSVSLADGASETVVFSVAARRAPGAVRLRVKAKAGALVSQEELDLPIMTAEPEIRQVQQIALGADSTSLTQALSGWREGTDQSSVWVTKSPYASSLTHLGYLARYPYGCVEQTTSGTRPLLYVREILDRVDPALAATAPVDDMVRSGIERVLSMQTPSGGLAYWPGGSHPSLWGTAYGTHMLLDAQEAGFQVSPEAVSAAVGWLSNTVSGRISGDAETAYAHYVLARGGKARPAQALRVLEDLQKRDVSNYRSWQRLQHSEMEYMLMAALHLGGDHRYESVLRKPDTGALIEQRVNDWSFWSGLRTVGLRLSIYQDLFGADAGGQAAADRLAAILSSRRSGRFNTQELGWALTALGKRMQAGEASLAGASLKVKGKGLSPTAPGAWSLRGVSAQDVQVTVPSGSGQVWAVISTRGVPQTDAVPLGSQGLDVQRTFVDGQGQALNPERLPLGTPIYVRVDIRNTGKSRQQNLALVDRLPAGWEIENMRLTGAALPPWASELDLWSAEHMNVRDDRVEVFGSLSGSTTRTVVYAVRAVTSGSFTLPAVQAEAMYDPEVWARRAGGTVEVVGPWDTSLL